MHTPRNYSSPSDRQLCQIYLLTSRGEKWERREIQEHSEGWCWFYFFYIYVSVWCVHVHVCGVCVRVCSVQIRDNLYCRSSGKPHIFHLRRSLSLVIGWLATESRPPGIHAQPTMPGFNTANRDLTQVFTGDKHFSRWVTSPELGLNFFL